VSKPSRSTRIFLLAIIGAMYAMAAGGVLLVAWTTYAIITDGVSESRRGAFDAGHCWVGALGGAVECPEGGRP